VVEERHAPATELYPGLKIVRTLAMLSIIGHHIVWRPVLGIAFGVTSLQIVMCALQSRHVRPRPLGEVARRRARRLLLPWILWCVIYGLFEVMQALRWDQSVLGRFDSGCWFAGTSFHLWFLPFAFLASLIASRAPEAHKGHLQGLSALLFAALGAGLVLAAPILHRELEPMRPFSYWLDGAGTIAFGIAIGRLLSLPTQDERNPWFLLILMLGTLPLLIGPELVQVTPLYERYAVAVSLVTAGFLLRCRDYRILALLSTYNLGVYLVHMLVLRAMGRYPSLVELPLMAQLGLCYLLCLLAVGVIRRLRIPHLS